MKENILITGGLGYIGSHAVITLHDNGYRPVIIDNLSNSKPTSIENIKKIISYKPDFHHCDIRDKSRLKEIFNKYKFKAVFHFAGLKSVEESIKNPVEYFDNNVIGTKNLIEVMLYSKCEKLIFSSSATVYGNPKYLPIDESHILNPINPYGDNKKEIEDLCHKLTIENPNFSCIALRYFNPIGAHPSGLIGEEPNGKPNNIMPIICNVASKINSKLYIYGDDYNTKDGTCIRDYIHVQDLVEGHIAAFKYLDTKKGYCAVNLGTGRGYSVKDLVLNFEKNNKIKIKHEINGRRKGDAEEIYADASLAHRLFKWKVKRSIEDMVIHSWQWQRYRTKSIQ